MSKVVTICLGNAEPIQYAKHPQPVAGSPLDHLEMWATTICGLDISGVPDVGGWMPDRDGNPSYQVTEAHRAVLLSELIAAPYRAPYPAGKKERTHFEFPTLPDGSMQDSLSEALTTIRKNWYRVGAQAPGWVAGTDAFLVEAVRRDLGIPEVREYLPEGERGEFSARTGV